MIITRLFHLDHEPVFPVLLRNLDLLIFPCLKSRMEPEGSTGLHGYSRSWYDPPPFTRLDTKQDAAH